MKMRYKVGGALLVLLAVGVIGLAVTLSYDAPFEPTPAVAEAGGAFAEFVTVRESGAVARKPASITFEEAAAVPVAAITALQALRDKGRLEAGQSVLINGASGGSALLRC
jgi:NADPH:quinone reductase-like Zn-dependent oxidoreductase